VHGGRRKVDTGKEAKCFADYMRIHTLEGTGGKTSAQMPRFATADGKGTNNPTQAAKNPDGSPQNNAARDIWVTETALTTALYTSYFAENVSLFAIIVGIALLLVGIGSSYSPYSAAGGHLPPRRSRHRSPPSPPDELDDARGDAARPRPRLPNANRPRGAIAASGVWQATPPPRRLPTRHSSRWRPTRAAARGLLVARVARALVQPRTGGRAPRRHRARPAWGVRPSHAGGASSARSARTSDHNRPSDSGPAAVTVRAGARAGPAGNPRRAMSSRLAMAGCTPPRCGAHARKPAARR
jgi:hypothetical protein